MCGIAGILQFDGSPVNPAELMRMQERLKDRGPDGQGQWLRGAVGLGHRRLSVVDLPGGSQPMGDGRYCLVYNGEIYNHRILRRELEAAGEPFSTDHSDTEVLLRGYAKWGQGVLNRLNGMFAFAIWDDRERELFLARDRMGKKPLYWHRAPGRLGFASTPAALLAAIGDKPRLCRTALAEYLSLGYTHRGMLLEGIEKLPPGAWMRVKQNGEISQDSFWRPGRNAEPDSKLSAQAGDLEPLLREAVERRLEADVPLGAFLSGGLDSSLVCALAQSRLKQRGERLKTFSVSMPDRDYDEGPRARRVAEHLGCEHQELVARPDIEKDLQALTDSMGEPFGDSSLLATYRISRAAREQVTCVLSGDGGDELFGGYRRYAAMRLLKNHRRWLSWIPVAQADAPQKSRKALARRLVRAAREPQMRDQYASLVRIFRPEHLRELGLSEPAPDLPDWHDEQDPAQSARNWDLAHYLPDDLLAKVDRASMATGLEVRCPLLDSEVVAWSLSRSLAARSKQLLKEVAGRHLPREMIDGPKMGFALPIGRWMAGELKGLLQARLLENTGLQNLGMRREILEKYLQEHAAGGCDHTHRLYALLSLSFYIDTIR